MKERIVFVVSVIAFCVSGTFAYDWSANPGDGSPQNPYQISEPNQLMSIGSNAVLLNKYFILMNDITFDPLNNPAHVFHKALIAPDLIVENGNSGFEGTPFSGVLDGRGHSIISFFITDNGTRNDYLGLVGLLVENGAIKNLTIENITVISNDESRLIGGLIGSNGSTIKEGGTIINCHIHGFVTGGYYTSGLCGSNGGANNGQGSIMNCTATVSVKGTHIGGLCGINNGILYDSSSSGTARGNGRIGGLCGWNEGTVRRCYTSVDVTGEGADPESGGFCGYNGRGPGLIYDSYATGNVACVSGSGIIGGFCGSNRVGEIYTCFSTGSVGAASDVGGFVGYNGFGMIQSCYFLNSAGPDNGYGTPLDDPNMRIQENFVDLDFVGEETNGINEIWWMCVDGVDYPRLSWEFGQGGDYACPDGVGMDDLEALAFAWLTADSDPDFNYAADGSGDGRINQQDMKILSTHWKE